MKRVSLYGLCAAVLAVSPALAQEPVKLKYASPAPPQSLVTKWGVGPWIEEVTKASGGTIEVQMFLGAVLGNFTQVLDRTLNGVNEMTWGILGPYSDQFPQTDVASLPFTGEQGRASSVALQRLFEQGLIKDDWDKFKVLTLFNFPPASFHSNKPIKHLTDFRGMKIGVSVRNISELVEVVGAAPVTMQPSEMYQAGQRGVVEGLAMAWPAFFPFKLHEVTKYHFDGSFGGTPSFVVMNKTAYEKLPAKAKAAIDSKAGVPFAEHMGKVTDRQNSEGFAAVKKMPGHTFFKLEPAEQAQWKQRYQPMIDRWVRSTPNGAAVLAAYQTAYEKALKEEK